MRKFAHGALLFIAIALIARTGYAQSSRGTVVGTVRDASGAVLPGVSVTVTNTGTNISRSAVTNESGDYVFAELNIGTYSVSGELPGFKTAVLSRLQLDVDQRLRADLLMQVGEVSDKVDVVAEAQLVSSDSASVGTVVETRRMIELPLKRDILTVALLTPGALPTYAGSNLSSQGGGISVNGFRETMNNIMLDGVEDREMGIDQITVNLALDAMAEMKVQSSSYSAEYGRQAGAQINMTTKSGTNSIHGTLYEFFRNSAMNAKNYFDPAFYKKPEGQRNVFGVSIGGPIQRDRTFFFFNYDGTRAQQGLSRTTIVPTPLQIAGNFSQSSVTIKNPYTGQPFQGNIIPGNMIDAVGSRIAALFPAPNVANPVQNYVSSPPQIQNRNQYTVRIDHKFNDKDSLFGRYTYNGEFLRNPFGRTATCSVCVEGPDGVPYGEISWVPGHIAGISWTHVFSSRLFNEARIGFNRLNGGIYPGHYGVANGTRSLGIQNTGNKCPTHCTFSDATALGYPSFTVAGFSSLGESGDQDRRDNTFQYLDSFNYNTGSHSIKIGGEFRKFQKNRTDSPGQGSMSFTGTYSGSGLADLLLGLPASASQNIPVLGYSDTTTVHTRQMAYGLYAQDDWRVRRNLTLNLGLRWDATSPGKVSDNKQSNFDFNTGQVILATADHRYLVPWYLKDYGPRFGLSWTPIGEKTVIRAGYGLFFDAKTNVTWNSFATNPPFINSYNYQNTALGVAGAFVPKFTLSNMFPSDPKTAASAPTLNYTMLEVGKPLADGYGQQFSLNIQRELAPSLVLEVGYVGSKGTRLDSSLNLNQPAPGPGTVATRRPYPQYGNLNLDNAQADSNYHSGQVRFEKRYSNGLSFLTSYTFAKNIDNTSATGGGPVDPAHGRTERGLSNNDIRHNFAYSYTWDLPLKNNVVTKGWELGGVFNIHTGQPVGMTIPSDVANVGRTGQRPNANGNPNFPRSQRSPSRWFDASVFSTPALYTFGNAGRNTIEGPGFNQIDFSIMRNFLVGEQGRLQFRGQVFNIANHPNFNPPGTILGQSPGIVSGAQNPRQMEFALKYYF
jgi:outer membrane receptor protein involved in Fe transport